MDQVYVKFYSNERAPGDGSLVHASNSTVHGGQPYGNRSFQPAAALRYLTRPSGSGPMRVGMPVSLRLPTMNDTNY